MSIISDWKWVLTKAWSVKFMLLAAAFSALEVSFPLLEGYVDIPPRTFAAISGLLTMAAFISRFYAQVREKDGE